MRDAVNIQAVQQVASALKDLRERVVFVGGAIISLYADDPGADVPRPTADIDLVIEVTGYGAYARLEQRLAELGFHHSPEDQINCRYRHHGVLVDIMPTDVPAIGPTNRWYMPGIIHSIEQNLPDGSTIRMLTAAHFLGTKFEAHRSRGGDMRVSKDFEDIVYVLDSRMSIEQEIVSAPEDIRGYLSAEAHKLLKQRGAIEAMEGHLHPSVAGERVELIVGRLQRIAVM